MAALDRWNGRNIEQMAKTVAASARKIAQSRALIERYDRIIARDKEWWG